MHACALLDNASVKCWGTNYNGGLGLGDNNNRGDAANEMGDNLSTVDLGTGRTATAMSLGSSHTCALLDNSDIKCWGSGDNGRLGQGTNSNIGNNANDMGDNLPAIDL
jgi:alpha-tubulin suppressor-like RCC1 family protein